MFGVRFSGIRGDAASYVKAKLLAAGVEEVEIAEGAGDGNEAIVLADAAGLSIGHEAMIEIRARRRCATSAVDQMLPLIEGERIEEDYFTFLVAPFEELVPGTAVMRRTTNMGVSHIFFPDFQVNQSNELVYTGLPADLVDPALMELPPPRDSQRRRLHSRLRKPESFWRRRSCRRSAGRPARGSSSTCSETARRPTSTRCTRRSAGSFAMS